MTKFNFFAEPSNTGPNDVSLEFAINTANLLSDTSRPAAGNSEERGDVDGTGKK